MSDHDARRADGFSLVELMVAMTILLVVTAGVFDLMNPAQGAFQTQPEAADMQQRLRVAADSLYRDVVMAGAGAYQGAMSGSLSYFFAPVLPFRQGAIADDPPGTYRSDVITVIYVPSTNAQTTLATKGPALASADIGVNKEPNCPPRDDVCGFEEGMIALIYDASGNYDLFEITRVQENALHLQHRSDTLTYTNYEPITTKIVQVLYREYYLKTDDRNGVYQLMSYDGSSKSDVPVVDNVVGLTFEYFGDPQPPLMKKELSDAIGPWTSYGPKPSPVAIDPYGAGENCIFVNDRSPTPAPRLETLGPAGSGLVKLTAARLTDGPWCPNATSANRWDADLLRIRKVGVTLRVQAAVAALRGPASVYFRHGGTSTDYNKWAPDQEVHFEVTPRNLNLGR